MSIEKSDLTYCLTEHNKELVCTVFGREDLGNITSHLRGVVFTVLNIHTFPATYERLNFVFRMTILNIVYINYPTDFCLKGMNKNIPSHQLERWLTELFMELSKDEKSFQQAQECAKIFVRTLSF